MVSFVLTSVSLHIQEYIADGHCNCNQLYIFHMVRQHERPVCVCTSLSASLSVRMVLLLLPIITVALATAPTQTVAIFFVYL